MTSHREKENLVVKNLVIYGDRHTGEVKTGKRDPSWYHNQQVEVGTRGEDVRCNVGLRGGKLRIQGLENNMVSPIPHRNVTIRSFPNCRPGDRPLFGTKHRKRLKTAPSWDSTDWSPMVALDLNPSFQHSTRYTCLRSCSNGNSCPWTPEVSPDGVGSYFGKRKR